MVCLPTRTRTTLHSLCATESSYVDVLGGKNPLIQPDWVKVHGGVTGSEYMNPSRESNPQKAASSAFANEIDGYTVDEKLRSESWRGGTVNETESDKELL